MWLHYNVIELTPKEAFKRGLAKICLLYKVTLKKKRVSMQSEYSSLLCDFSDFGIRNSLNAEPTHELYWSVLFAGM